MDVINRVQLRDDIVIAFNEEELDALCRRLGVAYDDLSGNTQRDRASVLIGKMERERRLPELVAQVVQERPFLHEKYTAYLQVERPDVAEDDQLGWLDRMAGGEGAPIEEPPTMKWDTEATNQEDET